MAEPLLTVEHLDVTFPGRGFRPKPASVLRDVSISIPAGKTLGLVGESGSGKSTLGRAILGLAPVSAGTVSFDGADISRFRRARRRRLANDIQVIFQDPYSSLNPSLTIEAILTEPLRTAGIGRREAQQRIRELLDRVGLPSDAHTRLPREFSGGQRQRIAIARALTLNPKLIVCDEPTSALDLTTQARVLDLLLELQRESHVAYLFISHDLSVVRHVSDEVAVLYRGEVVETGPATKVTTLPDHAYTQRLLLAAPVPHPARQRARRDERQRVVAQTA